MKAVILAGGLGSRLAEETEIKPKPMVEIGGRPILWHILRHYSYYGIKEFVVALGYKGEAIKRYFLDYNVLNGSMSLDLTNGSVNSLEKGCEDWLIHLIDTGQETNTGGRVLRLAPFLKDETFMLTYGDGVCDIDLNELLAFHRAHQKIVTITAVRPPSRFGGLVIGESDVVTEFTEKPQIGEGWINGGFMVCEPSLFNYLNDDDDSLEADALERIAADRQLAAYRHSKFWQCMDTLRDKRLLDSLWNDNRAPWKR